MPTSSTRIAAHQRTNPLEYFNRFFGRIFSEGDVSQSAQDATVTMLTGATGKAKDHARSARQLRTALANRPEAVPAEKAPRELITIKGEVEYGTTLITLAKAEPLIRSTRTLVDLATRIVRAAP